MLNKNYAKSQPIPHTIQDYIYENKFILKDGIFYASSIDEISYPEESRDILFEIEDKSFWFQHRNRCIVELIKCFPPDGMIFDVGGGNGFVSKAIHDAGFSVALVEPGVGGALNARKRGEFDVICAMFNRDNFMENSVQGVALFDVIEHMQNDAEFIRSVNALMKPGGYVFITVPAYQWLWSSTDADGDHCRRYTAGSLSGLMQSNGFKVLFQSYIFSYLPLPIFLARALPYRLGIRGEIQEKAKRELAPPVSGGLMGSLLNQLSDYESMHIKKGKRLPFGGSIIMVVQKTVP